MTNDMRPVIVPKSDQVNTDDLLAGPITITVERVTIRPGTEQPVSIHFSGDGGKPYKPCKSMCRAMVALWGPDANQYVGRSMTLYADPTVKWAGLAVGGIRISHMSHIDRPAALMLTATKGSKKPFTVQPLTRTAGMKTPPRPKREDFTAPEKKGLAASQEPATVEQVEEMMQPQPEPQKFVATGEYTKPRPEIGVSHTVTIGRAEISGVGAGGSGGQSGGYALVDSDGEVKAFTDPVEASRALCGLLQGAVRSDNWQGFDGVWESNELFREQLEPAPLATLLAYHAKLAAQRPKPEPMPSEDEVPTFGDEAEDDPLRLPDSLRRTK